MPQPPRERERATYALRAGKQCCTSEMRTNEPTARGSNGSNSATLDDDDDDAVMVVYLLEGTSDG